MECVALEAKVSTSTTEPPPSTTTDSGRGWARIRMSVTTVLAEAAMVSVVVVCWPGLVLQCCSAAVLPRQVIPLPRAGARL